jgi:hypothetical protein
MMMKTKDEIQAADVALLAALNGEKNYDSGAAYKAYQDALRWVLGEERTILDDLLSDKLADPFQRELTRRCDRTIDRPA